MTRVAESSSGSGSSPKDKVFDIATESGMLVLLRSLHRSELKQKTKNELRDLIFSVNQAGEIDHEAIIKAFSKEGFTVVFTGSKSASELSGEVKPVEPPGAPRLGRARFTPSFSSQPVSVASPSVPPSENKISADGEPAPAPEPNPGVKPAENPAPVTPPPAQASNVVAEPAVVPQAASTPEATMERIKEIKRLVNEKVGNPITLIDTDNQIGREYMNSLLSAMKTANGGRPEEITAAMNRLEAAYKAAIEIVENSPPPQTETDKFVAVTTPTPPEPAPAPAAVPPPAPVQPSVQPTAVVTPPPPSTPVQVGVPTYADNDQARAQTAPAGPVTTASVQPSTDNQPPAQPVPMETNTQGAAPVKLTVNSSTPVSPTTPPASTAVTPQPPVEPVPLTPNVSRIPQSFTKPPAAGSVVDSSTPGSTTAAGQSTQQTRLMSVAKEEQLQSLMRQNQAKEVEAGKKQEAEMRANTDPLQLPEVTAGLKQLLSEWGLFKSSGFFGTGPGGTDHPLYKKISGLTMAAVIAGRFEGATPQVKQSITDYMNGWRYEEGIVHEHTETFEHYLRRVIRHILDTKDNKNKAQNQPVTE